LHDREILLGAQRAFWRLLRVLGSSSTPSWVFSSIHGDFSPIGVGEENGLQFGGENAKERRN